MNWIKKAIKKPGSLRATATRMGLLKKGQKKKNCFSKNIKEDEEVMAKKGLYANIHAKRKRIQEGSKEKMRKVGSKGAPTSANFKRAAKTAKKK